jgi:ATP-dependent Clp protease ATP-binding subunit ClpB
MASQNRHLKLSDSARKFLVLSGTDLAWGARPLRRAIQKELENPLARLILEGKFPEGATVQVEDGAGALHFQVPQTA